MLQIQDIGVCAFDPRWQLVEGNVFPKSGSGCPGNPLKLDVVIASGTWVLSVRICQTVR